MSVFTLQNVHKDFGIKEILRGASFSIEASEKVGLIGTNGSGKSTLLKMIAGLEPIDSGDLWTNSQTRIIYLPQQPEVDPERTVLEQIFADSGETMQLVQEYEALSHQMAHTSGDDLEQLMKRFSRVTELMDAKSAWDLETRAKIILSKLGIENFEARVGDLSGGYRKRIALATALLKDPDVLLMDEPTNHLDAASVEWLQEYLNQFSGAILLITHDRYFLDKVTHRILEVDRGDLYSYDGNYSYYLEKKALAEEAAASSQQKHRGILRREYEWLKQGPKARSTKQRARIDRIKDMETQEFKEALGNVEISTPGRRIGKKVIEATDVSKAYGDRILIQDFTYEFTPSDRIGIIGGNGVGKSTLINIITGRIPPDTGTVDIGSTIHIGYFDQHSDPLLKALNENQRVIDYIKEEGSFVQTSDGTQISASQMLERFLFTPNQQYTPIHKLSGGEKRRLFLLRILMSAPNVLILDEPTNDLDVQTLSVLEDYLEEFNGCAITVSHDRYFLDRTVNTLFVFEGNGILRRYPGNYSTYLDFKRAEESEAQRANGSIDLPLSKPGEAKSTDSKSTDSKSTDSKSTSSKSSSRVKDPVATPSKPGKEAKPRKLSYKEKREFEQLETQIPEMEAEKASIETILYHDPPADYEKVQQLSERLAELDSTIDEATTRWMMLAEIAG